MCKNNPLQSASYLEKKQKNSKKQFSCHSAFTSSDSKMKEIPIKTMSYYNVFYFTTVEVILI